MDADISSDHADDMYDPFPLLVVSSLTTNRTPDSLNHGYPKFYG